MDVPSLQTIDDAGKSPIHKHNSELNHQVDSVSTCHKKAEENHNNVDNVPKRLPDVCVGEFSSMNAEKLRYDENSDAKPSYESGLRTPSSEVLEQTHAKGTGNIENGSLETQAQVCDQLGLREVGPGPDGGLKSPGLQQIGATQGVESLPGNVKKGRGRPRKGTNIQGVPRTLRPKLHEKTTVPETVVINSAERAASREKRRKRKKKMKEALNDEFSKIRKHLRYFLSRINYEQNLIHAYAGEGWKGQSLEKIRPEKELERAKSEILRRKLKIRDLFQRIDISCAEGRIPESLFDDQGEIDSEDIFCAKCGSTDVQLDNDIILCDGDCERGFHQFCLEPPLLKEDVPPGDEGWLCPACDCKVDCIDLLNESQGTNLTISDDWEKVFPEAALVGHKMDDMGLSSEDSEDDDYNPDGPELKEEVEGDDESSSADDYFSSTSENLESVTNNSEQFLGLPSDDSEDDDFDPDKAASDDDEQAVKESSGYDFTSDSDEDVSSLLKDTEFSSEVHELSVLDKIKGNGKPLKNGGGKKETLNGGSLTLLESDPREIESAGKGKRHVERLDYKRLHDEEYGCDPSSDSSDEDYNDTGAPKKRKNRAGKTTSVPSSLESSPAMNVAAMDKKKNGKQSDGSRKSSSKKPNVEGTSSSQAKSDNGSNSNDGAKTVSRRLGEVATQKLYGAFKKNHFPGREDKENLAKDLSLTYRQVDKWFGNARWSFNHSSKSPEVAKTVPKSESVAAKPSTNAGTVNNQQSEASPGNLIFKDGDMQSSKTPISRKRKSKSDPQDRDPISNAEKTPKKDLIADSPTKTPKKNSIVEDSRKSQAARRSGRIQSKSGGKTTS